MAVAQGLLVACGPQSVGSSGCDTQSQLLHGMWNLSGLGMEPVSPASAGGFPSTVPPGKSSTSL